MKTLYEQLGEEQLKLLVSRFYHCVFSNIYLQPLFQNPREEIEEKQLLFLRQFLGGPQNYSERFGHPRMRARHLPHKIDQKAKEEWLSCMLSSVNSLEISDELKKKLFQVFPPVAEHMVNS